MARKGGSGETQGAVTCQQLAELLSRSGAAQVTAADILGDVAAGAPRLPDGTIPLLPYFVWLWNKATHG